MGQAKRNGTYEQRKAAAIKDVGATVKNTSVDISMKKDYPNKPMIQFTLKGFRIDLFFISWVSLTRPHYVPKEPSDFGDDVPF